MGPEHQDSESEIGRARPSLGLVVPLFNEEERFAEHAGDLRDFVNGYGVGSGLVFVDDGSSDRTVELVEDFIDSPPEGATIRLLRRPHEGKGAAVQAGLEAGDGDLLAFCDVDLSTPLSDLARVVDIAHREQCLAIASRDVEGSRIVEAQSPTREWMGRQYNRLVRATLVRGVADTQCGAKAAPACQWAQVLVYTGERGMAWDVEVVAIAQSMGLPVREVPVMWAHDTRSRVHALRDGLGLVTAVPRIGRRLRQIPKP